MFNQILFNKSFFNITEAEGLSGSARAVSYAQGNIRAIRYLGGVASAISDSDGVIIRGRYLNGSAFGLSGEDANYVRGRMFSAIAEAISGSRATGVVSTESFSLYLPDLIMAEGDVLQIDTGNKTVFLNGDNAVYLLEDQSEFFFLAPTAGIITVQSNDGLADVVVLWKERYV